MRFYLVYERRYIRPHNDNEMPVCAYEHYFQLWYLAHGRAEFVAYATIYDAKMYMTPKPLINLPDGATLLYERRHDACYTLNWTNVGTVLESLRWRQVDQCTEE